MERPVHHHAYIERPFDQICDELAAEGPELVERATGAAARFAADLAGYLEERLGFFDKEERVTSVVGEMAREPTQAVLPVEWRASETRRLLPNVRASLHIVPILSAGPRATTEITLQGRYSPAKTRHGGFIEHALARRLVDATLHVFLRRLAASMGDPPAQH